MRNFISMATSWIMYRFFYFLTPKIRLVTKEEARLYLESKNFNADHIKSTLNNIEVPNQKFFRIRILDTQNSKEGLSIVERVKTKMYSREKFANFLVLISYCIHYQKSKSKVYYRYFVCLDQKFPDQAGNWEGEYFQKLCRHDEFCDCLFIKTTQHFRDVHVPVIMT